MIGSFWNLCRACPSMPVDKLHSEYRSTYRWHEYKGTAAGGGVVRQPAPAPAPTLPQTRDLFTGPVEPAMPRRKKYPGLAYKTNEIFDSSAPGEVRIKSVTTSTLDRARSIERNENRAGAGRRSKSEGPRQPRWTDTVEPKGTATGTGLGEVLASKEPGGCSTEYRNQFAWPKDSVDSVQPRKSISMGTLKLGQSKRKPPVGEGTTEMEPLMNNVEDNVNEEHASKKHIEDYLWNGQKPGMHRGLKGKASSLEREEGSTERMLPHGQGGDSEGLATLQGAGLQSLGLTDGSDSWYREVLDLRKRAGEYKYRGWGTELAPEHITQLYNKQIELWYQVSRRSSLSALSLAATNHKALPSGEKDAIDAKNRSPKKLKSRTAPHQSIHAKLQETRQLERSPQKTSPQKIQRKKLQGHSFDETAAAGEGKTGQGRDSARTSPRKQLNIVVGARAPEQKEQFRSPRRRPRSADPKPTQAQQPMVNGHEPPKPHKPTGLPLNSRVRSASKMKSTAKTPSPTTAANTNANANRRSRSVSKVGIKLDNDAPSIRSASVAKDHIFDDTPVIKSPPEPTRVKSPEQMNMRSPDPVNWTVPLDTGKTFTVTQNVKNDDSVKRPSSDFKTNSICEEQTSNALEGAELAPVHHHTSPIRTLKKSESPTGPHKRIDAFSNKTPTSPASLTPIDETKTLDITRPMTNGALHSTQITPTDVSSNTDLSKMSPNEASKMADSKTGVDLTKKLTEATQKATGQVDTSVVNENTSALTAAEVLDRARTRFDKFWGKKEEDNV